METNTASQRIGGVKHRRKKKEAPPGKLSLKHSLLLFWVLIFCLLLVYLVSNPITRSEASNNNRIPQAELASGIPGLTYKKLAAYLRPLNIFCQPALQTNSSFMGACEGISHEHVVDIRIQVYGSNPDSIDRLEVSMTQYLKTVSAELFQDVLGEISSLPYQGNKPQSARLWVEKSLSNGEVASEKFGGISFRLEPDGPATWRLLVGE